MSSSSDPHNGTALRTRREFLGSTLLGVGTVSTIPGFVASTIASLQHHAAAQSAPVTANDGRILVILQLAGGNDGLNTVVPFADDAYHRARGSIGLPVASLLKLDDTTALAPTLSGLRSIYDEGRLAIVQGVGYPNPNRSHFRSTEIWQCATDADKVSRTGWLGRYFDNACTGAPNPTIGVSLSDQAPQSFRAARHPGIALSSPELYRWVHGQDAALDEAFAALNAPDDPEGRSMDGSSIEMLAGGKSGDAMAASESPLTFLERTALNAQVSSEKVRAVATKAGNSEGAYPAAGRLSQSLRLVAQMIAGGLPARVYYVSHGGFDTHNNQGGERGTHQNLLRQLDQAVTAFVKDLQTKELYDQVTLMTFSEFGRRVRENGSGGTDHGTAAPLFVLGGAVKGGLLGHAPSLTDLDRGDLKHTVDFRSVYGSILHQCLGTDPVDVLGRAFPSLPLIG
ncbi:MAG: DUF1501 domain-containing protein [Verrucomicrobiales bacterium]